MKPGLSITLCLALFAATASAIQPVTWTHTTEADFAEGETDHTVVTNLGDVKLASSTSILALADENLTVLYDVEQLGDVVYVAAGPGGKLLKLDGDKLVEVAAPGSAALDDNQQVFALLVSNGKLWVGVSGEESSRIAVLKDGALDTVIELPGVRYVWDMLRTARGMIIATGTEGKLLLADSNNNITEILDAEQANLLTLSADKKAMYAGSDTDGLVYRIQWSDEQKKYETFVVYDAAEPEIATLLATDDGILYVGTADAEQARPGRLGEASQEQAGRPDSAAAASESEESPGEEPSAPTEPSPIPNEPPAPEPLPEPIPQDSPETPLPEAAEAAPGAAEADSSVVSSTADTEPAPSAEQYDQLRDLMRTRLENARKTGNLQVEGFASSGGGGPASSSSQRARPTKSSQAEKKEGNAVYRIDADGFVREVFRETVMILKLIKPAKGDNLLVLTGNEGQVYRVDPSRDETTVLIDLDNEQLVNALLQDDGSVLIAAANPAQLIQLDDHVASKGIYTSKVMDAAQVSLFGSLTLAGDMPDGCSVTIETRTGNTDDPEVAAWSPWSAAKVFMPDPDLPELQPREIKIDSPPARFLQYRLTLTGNAMLSPAVDRIEMTHVTPNLRPAIASIKATYPEAKEPDQPIVTDMNIEWEASDPNNDPLIYKLEYRPAGSEKLLLLAEDIEETSHTWPTRLVPDGRYVLRLTADDRQANPGPMAQTAARLSDPVLIDNTPPEIAAQPDRQSKVLTVKGDVSDRLSKITAFAYSLDGAQEYVPILPDDLIFDSTSEAFTVNIADLSPGPHVLSLKATDGRGNVSHRSLLIE
ncbi:MAG: fibronectin type III domain-containing protein [Phycisphaeraceae bacterium]|nr:fibronectin type III domain-containing protein [Phycisphaeraceae bacterium]